MDRAHAPISVSLIDPAARNVVLTAIVKTLHEPDEARLEELLLSGLTPEMADKLHALTASDLLSLANSPNCRIGVLVDWISLDRAMGLFHATRRTNELLEYFITHGASRRLLRRLFSLTETEYRQRAQALGYDAWRRGRVPLPPENEREAIGMHWHAMGEAGDVRRRYYELHRRFAHHPIAALEHVVTQFTSQFAR